MFLMLLLNIVEYEEAFFPGLVIKVKKKTIEVSCLRPIRNKHWKFPYKAGLYLYNQKQMIEIIAPPTFVNSSGRIPRCPKAEKYWGIR